MVKIFTRVQKINWISYTNFNYLFIQTHIPKVIFMFPQVSNKIHFTKIISLNSIKLYNWCSNKKPKIKSLDKNLLISRQKTEWKFSSSIEQVGSKKRRDRWNDNLGPARNSGRLFVLKSKQFFFLASSRGPPEIKSRDFLKLQPLPPLRNKNSNFQWFPTKSLAPSFCFPCVP